MNSFDLRIVFASNVGVDIRPYHADNDLILYHNDCLNVLPKLQESTVDLIFADPPYNLSNGGISCRGGKFVSVNKGAWDKSQGLMNDFNFTAKWLKECRRVLKPTGTICITGTMHNIYQVGFALQALNYHIMNELVWFKPNASPNLSCRFLLIAMKQLSGLKKTKKQNIRLIITK